MSNEPKPVQFPASSSPSPAVPPAASAAREPQALIFPQAPASSKAAQPREPGAVSFPVKAAPIAPTPAVQPASTPVALSFPPSAPAPVARTPAVAFQSQEHPLFSAAMREAQALSAEVVAAERERVERYIRKLLPLNNAAVEGWGARCLEECRKATLATAEISRRFAALKSAERLESLLQASAPVVGIWAKAKHHLGESVERRMVRAKQLLTELRDLQPELAPIQKEVADESSRLAVLLLTLRACMQAAGPSSNSSLDQALHQRVGTLRAALTQAGMLPAQLKLVADTISLEIQQTDKLLNVTLSAEQLEQAVGKTTRA